MESSVKRANELGPSVREHGTDGYSDEPVGGFGAGYAAQVAHGGDSETPGVPSHSEHAENAPSEEDHALALSVRKALARAHIDAADLSVEVHGSIVRMRGTVRHVYEKNELEARARAVPGIASVVSEVSVLADGKG